MRQIALKKEGKCLIEASGTFPMGQNDI